MIFFSQIQSTNFKVFSHFPAKNGSKSKIVPEKSELVNPLQYEMLKEQCRLGLLFMFPKLSILNFSIISPCYFQGTIATMMTQPLDVLKTRAMNAKPGKYRVSHIEMNKVNWL